MQNLKFKFKTFVYITVVVLAYLAGENQLLNYGLSKLNPSSITSSLTSSTDNQNNFLNQVNNGRLISETGPYQVSYVVDGDTIHIKDINGVEDIVRLLAVNTSEKNAPSNRDRCFANMQSVFTRDNLLGKSIYLVYDDTQPKRDSYKRILAYVSTTTATSTYFYNDYLMQTGNAKVYRADPPAQNYSRYLQYERYAKDNKLGMWNPQLCN